MLEQWKLNPQIINTIKGSSSSPGNADINAAAAAIATTAVHFDSTIDAASIDAAIQLANANQMDVAIFRKVIEDLIEA